MECPLFCSRDRVTRITQTAASGSGVAAGTAQRIDYAYDAANRRTSETRSELQGTSWTAVVYTSYGYDDAGRLTQIVHRAGSATGTVLEQYDYAFDRAGRIINQTSSLDGAGDFQYDANGQLVGADFAGQADESYAYDDVGNRANAVVGPGNRLYDDGTFTYTYDDEGNRLTRTRKSAAAADDQTIEYAWDLRNRLAKVTYKNNSGTITQTVDYVYDPTDRRIAKTVTPYSGGTPQTAVVTKYVYGSGSDPAFLTDGAGNVTERYLWGAGVDELVSRQNSTDVLYALADHEGSIRDVARVESGAAVVKNHVRYGAFGTVVAQTDANYALRFAYTGQELDAETGLYYYDARYYDAATAKFLSEDPKGFAAGYANLTIYVGNNPYNLTDPTGMTAFRGSSLIPAPSLSGQDYLDNLVARLNSEAAARNAATSYLVPAPAQVDLLSVLAQTAQGRAFREQSARMVTDVFTGVGNWLGSSIASIASSVAQAPAAIVDAVGGYFGTRSTSSSTTGFGTFTPLNVQIPSVPLTSFDLKTQSQSSPVGVSPADAAILAAASGISNVYMNPQFAPSPSPLFTRLSTAVGSVFDTLESAGNFIKEVSNSAADYLRDTSRNVDNKYLAIGLSLYSSQLRTIGNLSGSAVDVRGTVQSLASSTLDRVGRSIDLGREKGWNIGVSEFLGVNRIAEAITNVDIRTGQQMFANDIGVDNALLRLGHLGQGISEYFGIAASGVQGFNVVRNATSIGYNAPAAIHPGRIAAESADASRASVMRALRAADTPEAHAVAKLLKRGKVDIEFLPTDPFGQGAWGRAPWGSKTVQVYLDKAGDSLNAAGIVAHETRHVLDKFTPQTYTLLHELRAYQFQRNAGFLSLTDDEILNFIKTSELYRNVPRGGL